MAKMKELGMSVSIIKRKRSQLRADTVKPFVESPHEIEKSRSSTKFDVNLEHFYLNKY